MNVDSDVVEAVEQRLLLVDGYVDLNACIIHRDGRQIRLTPIDRKLLLYLALRPNQTVSQDELLVNVWE